MPVCAAEHCSNIEKKGFRLFRFPSATSQKERRKSWIENSGYKGSLKDPRLCEVGEHLNKY